MLLALLEGLSFNVLSGDVWFLAEYAAKRIALAKYGVSHELFEAMLTRIRAAREDKVRENPLHGMF